MALAILEQVGRWASIIFGLSLLWLGLLMVPDEQRKWQSRFTDWWVRIEERREEGLSRSTAFLVTILERTDRIFSLLMGLRLVSWRAVSASLVLSVASMAAVGASRLWVGYIGGGDIEAVVAPMLFFALGLLQLRAPRWWPLQLSLALLGALPLWFRATDFEWYERCHYVNCSEGFRVEAVVIVTVALILSFLSDILFIIVARGLLRSAIRGKSLLLPIALMATNVALAAALVGIPFEITRWIPSVKQHWVMSLYLISEFLVGFNVLDAAVALLFLPIAGMVLLDRVLWSLFSRALQVLQAEHILINRKALIALGATFIGFGSGRFGAFLHSIIGH